MSQSNYIPDISYHLVFCFLSFHQLPLIAQCSKEWNRIVTEPQFLNMFRHNETTNIVNIEHISNAHSSALRHMIRKVSMSYQPLKSTQFLTQFHHLQFLDIKIKWEAADFDITSVFKALGSHLLELKVHISSVDFFSNYFFRFENALCFLTSLTSLHLTSNRLQTINDTKFLTQMKQLKTFVCDCIDFIIVHESFTQDLSCCSELTHLNLFEGNEIAIYLSSLSESLKNTKLNHLGGFLNVSETQQYECLDILNNLSYLQTIGIRINAFYEDTIPPIPKILGKWIQHLEILGRVSDQDVIDINSLPYLKSLVLNQCMNNFQIKMLIEGLPTRLEHLCISSARYLVLEISFQSLSRCIELKTLDLSTIVIINEHDFESLQNLKQLESITIIYSSFGQNPKLNFASPNIQSALKLPSHIFPKLKKVDFQICYY
jgi:hypothetical protein